MTLRCRCHFCFTGFRKYNQSPTSHWRRAFGLCRLPLYSFRDDIEVSRREVPAKPVPQFTPCQVKALPLLFAGEIIFS